VSAPRTDVEQVELANTAFYEALERGDFEGLSSLWLAPLDTADDDIEGDGAVISCVTPAGRSSTAVARSCARTR
jgi:hypothetical protein